MAEAHHLECSSSTYLAKMKGMNSQIKITLQNVGKIKELYSGLSSMNILHTVDKLPM